MYTTLRRPSASRRGLWLVFVRVSQSDGGANWDDSGHAMPSTPLPVSLLDRLKNNTIEIQQQPKSQANDHPHAATTANATQLPLSLALAARALSQHGLALPLARPGSPNVTHPAHSEVNVWVVVHHAPSAPYFAEAPRPSISLHLAGAVPRANKEPESTETTKSLTNDVTWITTAQDGRNGTPRSATLYAADSHNQHGPRPPISTTTRKQSTIGQATHATNPTTKAALTTTTKQTTTTHHSFSPK